MKSFFNSVHNYLHIFTVSILLLIIFAVSRGFFAFIYQDDFGVGDLQTLFINGLRCDVSFLGYAMALPVLLVFLANLMPNDSSYERFFIKTERIYLFIVCVIVIFMELCTYPFMDEYGQRPNRLFFEYLKYPKEVYGLLIKGHLTAVLYTVIGLLIGSYVFWKLLTRLVLARKNTGYIAAVISFVIFGALAFIAGRSTLQHRPLNLAMVYFSSNARVNAMIGNSTYSLFDALKSWTKEKDNDIYPSQAPKDTLRLIREDTDFDFSKADDIHPTLNTFSASWKGEQKNIVVILQESLGAQYVSSLGGLSLTPHIDGLYEDGIAFTNMYATGVRSIRGIEAVTTGFTPTRNTAVVKRDLSQRGFINLASILNPLGYETLFVYGGESHFDNMKSFFLGNGYSKVIDQKDYKNPEFSGTWGVSDEDLYKKALETFDTLYEQKKKFYALVFSSSNHDPFEIPDRKLNWNDKHKLNTRRNAIQYADYAVGRLIKELRNKPYYDNTVFILIADHDMRARGKFLVPVKNFHIPAVIFGGGIEPKTIDHVVSQIDVPKTLLSMAGISADVPMLGYDLSNLSPDFKGRALMQYYDNFAYMNDDGEIIFLLPNEKVYTGQYNFDSHRIFYGNSVPNRFKNTALAYALIGGLSYKNGYYSNMEMRDREDLDLGLHEKASSEYEKLVSGFYQKKPSKKEFK